MIACLLRKTASLLILGLVRQIGQMKVVNIRHDLHAVHETGSLTHNGSNKEQVDSSALVKGWGDRGSPGEVW